MISAIRQNNLARLTLIPGVGRKTAERLVIELRDKIESLAVASADEARAPEPPSEVMIEDAVHADALSALVNLGYQRSAAEKAITSALGEGGEITVESILRRSLRRLAKP